MQQKDYQSRMTTSISAEAAWTKITQVQAWWTSHCTGQAAQLHDTFTLTFGENWFAFTVTESVPGKRLVWLVTDCSMPWLQDTKEWKGTHIVWTLTEDHNRTTIEMTHVGLVPEVECYDVCSTGWQNYFGESLPKLIETGKGVLFDDA